VLGIPLAFALLYLILGKFFSEAHEFLPQALTSASGETPAVAAALALGQPLSSFMPIVANAVWIVLFVGIAIWRFQREEI